MKNMWWDSLADIAMWFAVGAAIIVALIITGKVSVIAFFLIPMFGRFADSKSNNTKKEGGDNS